MIWQKDVRGTLFKVLTTGFASRLSAVRSEELSCFLIEGDADVGENMVCFGKGALQDGRGRQEANRPRDHAQLRAPEER
jgi:hypothetical protein